MRNYYNLTNKMQKEDGFSLIEILVTIFAAVVIIALVVPNMTRASQTYKLLTVSKEIEGQLQNARYTAINKNRSASVVISSDGSWYFLDTDGSGTVNGAEKSIFVPTGGYTLNSSAPGTALTSSVAGTSTNPATVPNRGVAFTSRGGVVQVNSSQVPTATKLSAPGVIYISGPNSRYAAVTITTGGRIRGWILNGSTWR